MKRIFILLCGFYLIMLTAACDKELFNLNKEAKEPESGDIQTDPGGFQLNAGDTASFWVNATDPDGKSLTYKWTKQDGIFLTTSDQDQVTWRAPYRGGTYRISVTISNAEKSISRSKDILVNSYIKPTVRILKPHDNAFLVQYQTQLVEVEAFHDNGIASVALYIGDDFAGYMDASGESRYQMNWYVDNLAGDIRIRTIALANTNVTSTDSIVVQIEGVIPGKK